jgi:hypothetical protein
MKILTVVGLAAGCCLASFLPAHSFAENSSNVSDVTCKAALDGASFTEISETNPADRCCYVLEEVDWYNTHDVLLQRWYQRQDDEHVYLTIECRSNVSQAGAASSASAQPSSGSSSNAGGNDDQGGPSSGMMSSAEGSHSSSSENGDGGHGHHSSSSSSTSSSASEASSELPGNPGNAKPVGGAGEAPNGDVSAFKPDPGTKGKSN